MAMTAAACALASVGAFAQSARSFAPCAAHSARGFQPIWHRSLCSNRDRASPGRRQRASSIMRWSYPDPVRQAKRNSTFVLMPPLCSAATYAAMSVTDLSARCEQASGDRLVPAFSTAAQFMQAPNVIANLLLVCTSSDAAIEACSRMPQR